MSAFNTLVPIGEGQAIVLRYLIGWNPNIGRLRYAWLSKDGTEGYILFKDGPSSWSENQEQVKAAILEHPLFKSWHVHERDSVYLVGTFDLTKIDQEKKDYIQLLFETDAAVSQLAPDYTPLNKDPFEIFDEGIKQLQEGTLMGEKKRSVDALTQKLKDAFDKGEGGIITV